MRCFVHANDDAVATCKNCSRGLCRACAVEFPDGVSCKGHCEAAVQAINSLISKNTSLAPTAGRVWYTNSVVFIAMGVAALYFGLTDFGDKPLNFTTLFGLISVGGGFLYYLRGRSIQRS
jgi:hypothetical protein